MIADIEAGSIVDVNNVVYISNIKFIECCGLEMQIAYPILLTAKMCCHCLVCAYMLCLYATLIIENVIYIGHLVFYTKESLA